MRTNALYKGCLEPIILKLLKENTRMYGYEMTQKVKEMTAGSLVITEGALYPLLHRLEGEGILSGEIEMNGNRPRKYYSLTAKGNLAEVAATHSLSDFIKTMNIILLNKKT